MRPRSVLRPLRGERGVSLDLYVESHVSLVRQVSLHTTEFSARCSPSSPLDHAVWKVRPYECLRLPQVHMRNQCGHLL